MPWNRRAKIWESMIGKPHLSLSGIKCLNIVCGKENRFKKHIDDSYICECGYIINGEFEEIKHKPKFYCKVGSSNCPDGKTSMNKECFKCIQIGER